ncbi:integral membrane protein 2C [Anoplophora glabripennis]|uniref:Integral membrane protein 2 n=1 Tax=Anoplophora glabripennis TaxID=217634 RepID=V5GPA9_ANOGL|nr:integral membrane protein 2C [Anoplophora glabripennis]
MTILTKPFTEKKGDKLEVPLVENEKLPLPSAPNDVEAQGHPRIIIFPARVHRVSTATTLCLLLTALSVVGIGIIGGKYLYHEYLSVSRPLPQGRFQGWAQIPMNDIDDDSDDYSNVFPETESGMNTDDDLDIYKLKRLIAKASFQENFEIDDNQKYEKIDVPDFRDGRSGRFIHDFNTNITGIIDITGHRCFVMPLNRQNVLPPKSLFDLIQKMWEGYYKVDTAVIRKTMKVVLPPITDSKSIGGYITSECEGLPIYKLEKYVGGVVKRSANLQPEAKFAQFAGNGITEFDIVNLEEVLAYEKQLSNI